MEKQKTYYSPTSGRFFNLKMIKRVCKKLNMTYTLDKDGMTVWFDEIK